MNPFKTLQQCLVVLVLTVPVQVAAGIYVYVDERGVEHYTNTPTSKKYKLATLRRLNTPRNSGYYNGHGRYNRRSSVSRNSFQYDNHIQRAADRYMVDPLLIKAVIKVESDFDRYATSSKGAQGLMQLMPGTARDLRVWDPYNASQNINGGTRYLKKLLDTYSGDLTRSLAAYNAGPGRVAKSGPLPRIKETREYIQKVSRYYSIYKQAGSSGKKFN